MHIQWAPFVLGAVTVAGGVLLIVFPAQISRFEARANREWWRGREAKMAHANRPAVIRGIGIGSIVGGAVVVTLSIVLPPHQL